MPPPNDPDFLAYRRLLAAHGGQSAAVFVVRASVCVRRWLRQNECAPLGEGLLAGYLLQLWKIVDQEGLPPPLMSGEPGLAGEMSAARVAGLIERIYAGVDLGAQRHDLDTVTRQLVKACLQPEFRKCRESYKAVVNGSCRRQERTRACDRISGSHCVDCPYWISLGPDRHFSLLEEDWADANPGELMRNRDIFLPEDFRELRVFLWQHARWAKACGER